MDANLRRQTLADTLRRSAARFPDRLCLACGAIRWTYREFHAVSERLAAGLAGQPCPGVCRTFPPIALSCAEDH